MSRTGSSTPTTRVSETEFDMDADLDTAASTVVASSPPLSVGGGSKRSTMAKDTTEDSVSGTTAFYHVLCDWQY
jgi:hypothetical protein